MTDQPGRYGIEDAIERGLRSRIYRKTLAGLRRECSTASSEGSALRFCDYPFEPASVFPNGAVSVEQVAEINLGAPPQVRLKSGEILFVPYTSKEALMTFANDNDLTIRPRLSVWTSLLDPFLDTWEEQSSIDAQFRWFERLGLDRSAVDDWRREVADAMLAYNFGTGLGEWGSLSLYDALRAQHAHLSHEAFVDFYQRAMRVTALDPAREGFAVAAETTLSSALSSALIAWYPRETALKNGLGAQSEEERWRRIKEMEQRLTGELTATYGESHRRYHTLTHVEHCLAELGGVWDHAIRLEEVRWAIVFHDAIYDSKRHDNESRSADWACAVMEELGRPTDERNRVRSMILATAHNGEPESADESLLLDIDLSILGTDEATFDAYDRAIRVEYDWVAEPQYREARARVLQSFLDRDRLYRTATLRRRYEAQARANLKRALERLTGQSHP